MLRSIGKQSGESVESVHEMGYQIIVSTLLLHPRPEGNKTYLQGQLHNAKWRNESEIA